MIHTLEGFQTTVLWPELLDDPSDNYEVGGEDERRSENGSRDPGREDGLVVGHQ